MNGNNIAVNQQPRLTAILLLLYLFNPYYKLPPDGCV